MVKESYIEKTISKYAESKDIWNCKFADKINGGLPDRIFIYKGIVFWIEFKSETGKVTPLQVAVIDEMRRNGARVAVVNDVKLGKALIDKTVSDIDDNLKLMRETNFKSMREILNNNE